jgi:hypothetical protein
VATAVCLEEKGYVKTDSGELTQVMEPAIRQLPDAGAVPDRAGLSGAVTIVTA